MDIDYEMTAWLRLALVVMLLIVAFAIVQLTKK
jgi:hypothetical protein